MMIKSKGKVVASNYKLGPAKAAGGYMHPSGFIAISATGILNTPQGKQKQKIKLGHWLRFPPSCKIKSQPPPHPAPFCIAIPSPSAARPFPSRHQSASRPAPAESGRQPLSARARGGASPAPSQDARRPAAGEVGAARGAQETRGAGEERAPASAPPPSGGAGAVARAEDRRGQGRDSEEGHGRKRER